MCQRACDSDRWRAAFTPKAALRPRLCPGPGISVRSCRPMPYRGACGRREPTAKSAPSPQPGAPSVMSAPMQTWLEAEEQKSKKPVDGRWKKSPKLGAAPADFPGLSPKSKEAPAPTLLPGGHQGREGTGLGTGQSPSRQSTAKSAACQRTPSSEQARGTHRVLRPRLHGACYRLLTHAPSQH